MPRKFTTRIEVNKDGKESSDILLNYDYDQRKVSIVEQSANMQIIKIFNYESNEIYQIMCKYSFDIINVDLLKFSLFKNMLLLNFMIDSLWNNYGLLIE